MTNLLIALDEVLRNRDINLSVGCVFLDFAKAFDVISHTVLLHKLRQYGVSGEILRWISNWLSERVACVRVGSEVSSMFDITSSVPQGSILGPLLFIIYVNDLCDVISSSLFQFFDDVKLVRAIHNGVDVALLRSDVKNILEWCVFNDASVRADKSALMLFGRDHFDLVDEMKLLHIDKVSVKRDLGFRYSDQCRFNSHRDFLIGYAIGRVIAFKRHFVVRSPVTVRRYPIYRVRPILETCLMLRGNAPTLS
eukprot:GHVN01064680.1.p1 GENE.GHVN01064680.1~~GHVN01064680.1.p1  ORF type:complete len:252 (-),score=3.40 GHVN01064680.1:1017-1772(-)